MISSLSKLLCSLILLKVPSIQYGGYYLLTLLLGRTGQESTDYQRDKFRERGKFRDGHAHAGVLVILVLVSQLLLDAARLPLWLV
jgi:hypothetical protein